MDPYVCLTTAAHMIIETLASHRMAPSWNQQYDMKRTWHIYFIAPPRSKYLYILLYDRLFSIYFTS